MTETKLNITVEELAGFLARHLFDAAGYHPDKWHSAAGVDFLPEARIIARRMLAADALQIALRRMLEMATDNRTHGPEIDNACAALALADGKGE